MNSKRSDNPDRRRAAARRPVPLILAAALLSPLAAAAQDDSDGWEWRATIYGWLPTIEGTTQFPTGGSGPSIEVGVDDLLDNLDFTFMGALDVHKGRWGAFTDVLYLDEGASKSAFRELTIGPHALPAEVSADVSMDLKSWVWSLAATWQLSSGTNNPVDLLFGTRMVDMDQTLNWDINGEIGGLPLPGRSGSSHVSGTNWDAIVGVKGYLFFGADSRWVMPYYLDVGTGDADFTWQAMAGVGYRFGWGALVLNYRYLDYQLGSDSPIDDLSFSGPMIGASFQW